MCIKAKRGSCGTDLAVRGCLFRPGGPLPALPRSGSKSAMGSSKAPLPPRPSSSSKARTASATAPTRKRMRGQRMSASTAAAAAALHQWHGRDPAALRAILETPAPAPPPLVAAGPPQPPPEPDAAALEEERRVLQTYERLVARRAAFPKVEEEMHAKLRVWRDARQRLDAIIAQQASQAPSLPPPFDPVVQPPAACLRADIASLGAFLFTRLAGAPGAMAAPS